VRHYFLILLLFLSGHLHAQVPQAPNAFDEDGKKHGKWVYILDYQFQSLSDTAKPRYYREIHYDHNRIVPPSRDYYLDGKLQWEGWFTHIFPDTLEGICKGYHSNGNEKFIANYQKGILNGPVKSFYENGNIELEVEYKSGSMEGEYQDYYMSGNKRATYNYENGGIQGSFIQLYEDGEIEFIGEYNGPNQIGQITNFYSDGNIEIIRQLREELHHGSYTSYYKNGQIQMQAYYNMDVEDSSYVHYYEDGSVQTKGQYMNGMRDGKWVWFDKNAAIDNVVFYESGEERSFTHYFPDNINHYNKKGERNGLWVFPLDNEWNYTSDTLQAMAYLNIRYRNGKPVGTVEEYYFDGQLATQMDLISDDPWLIKSFFRAYDTLGYLKSENKYKNGIKESHTGYHQNGNISEISYFDEQEKITDSEQHFYSDGTLKSYTSYQNGIKHGYSFEYYPNGQVKQGVEYRNGLKHGWEAHLNEFGINQYGRLYINGILTMGSIIYQENSKIKESIEPDNQGIFIKKIYNESEEVIASGTMDKNGEKHGLWNYTDYDVDRIYSRLYENGELKPTDLQSQIPKSENLYDGEEKTGPWTIYFNEKDEIVDQPENAFSYAIGTFERGIPTGLWEFYSINGILYIKGEVESLSPGITYHGSYVQYHESSAVYQQYQMVHNNPHGLFREFDEDGKLSIERIYKHGEVQSVKEYSPDGNLMAEGLSSRDYKHGIWTWYKKNGTVDYKKVFYEGNLLMEDGKDFSWDQLFEGGVSSDSNEEYETAIALLRWSLIKSQPIDSNSLETLKSHYHLGLAHGHNGDASEGLFSLQYVLDRIHLIEDASWRYDVYYFSARLMDYNEDFQEASDYYIKCLEIAETTHLGDEVVFEALERISYSLWQEGKSREATPFAIKRKDLAEKLFEDLDYSVLSSKNLLGILYGEQSKYEDAVLIYDDILFDLTEIEGSWNDDQYSIGMSVILNNALAESKLKNYDLAESDLIYLYDLYSDIYSDDEDYFTILNNFGTFYLDQDKYHLGLFYLKLARNWCEDHAHTETWDFALINGNLGTAYSRLGQYNLAQKYQSDALNYTVIEFGRENEKYIQLLNMYGVNLSYLENGAEKADSVLGEVIRLQLMVNPDSYRLCNYRHNRAFIMDKAGKIDEAEALFRENISILEKEFPDKKDILATSIQSLGLIAFKKGDMERYIKLLERSCREFASEVDSSSIELMRMRLHYAEALWRNGDREESLVHLIPANTDFIKYLSDELRKLTKVERDQLLQKNSERLQKTTSMYQQIIPDKPELTGTFYNYWLSSHALSQIIEISNRDNYRLMSDDEYHMMYNEYLDVNKQIINVMHPDFEIDVNELEDLKSRSSQLESNLIHNLDSSIQNKLLRVNWEQIQNNLKKDEAAVELVSFRHYERELTDSVIYGAFILRSTGYPEYVTLPDYRTLENTQFKMWSTFMRYTLTDYRSFNLYWNPVHEKLEGINHIKVSSNGIYHKINLNAIFNPVENKYLIDLYGISYVNSTADIINKKQADVTYNREDRLVAIGDPVFDTEDNYDIYNLQADEYDLSISNLTALKTRHANINLISPLPGTAAETNLISSVSTAYGIDVNLLQGNMASETNLKKSESPKILHIATHGFFSPEVSNSNYQAGLLFTGSQDMLNFRKAFPLKIDDGILYAGEAKYMDLGETDILALSACETGLGTIEPGKALSGLQQSFFVAGADNMIVSLWKVDDMATQKLMSSFYEQLFITKNINQAFRNAQRITREEYPHPKHWGAFKLISTF